MRYTTSDIEVEVDISVGLQCQNLRKDGVSTDPMATGMANEARLVDWKLTGALSKDWSKPGPPERQVPC